MNAVNIIFPDYFVADVCQVFCRLGLFGIHESVFTNAAHYLGIPFAQFTAADGIPFADGKSYHPGVYLHAATMSFVNDILQYVVSR